MEHGDLPIFVQLLQSPNGNSDPVVRHLFHSFTHKKIRAGTSSNASEVRGAGFTSDKIRAETSSNGSEVRGAGFTPHKIHVQTLWISGLCHLGQFALSPRESSLCPLGKAVFV